MTLNTKRHRFTTVISFILSVTFGACGGAFVLFLYNGYHYNLNNYAVALLTAVIVLTASHLFLTRRYRKRKKILEDPVPSEWDMILQQNVAYYNTLETGEKEQFKRLIQVFLGETLITGIGTNVDERDRLLIASSAIIPVFRFPEWEYDKLAEVLVYPSNFNDSFAFNNPESDILGMVIPNTSALIISKPSLLRGFRLHNDSINVGLHEFAHKVDEEDGIIDGIPALLMDHALIREWKRIIAETKESIEAGRSDLNPYALTNDAEFFAVATEAFFENPERLNRNHPELYTVMARIYRQDTRSMLSSVLKSMFTRRKKKTGRNDPCPCGSGKKYKKCCLNKSDR